jgi:tRNA-dihydrouridine synthase
MFSEFTNVDGLMSAGRDKIIGRLKFGPSEQNLVAQIWGLGPKNYQKVAGDIASGKLAREIGLENGNNFVGIDINMCCPAKSEVKAGACSALINNRPLAAEIIKATKAGAAGKLPISVKARVGFSSIDLTWIEFLLEQKLDMLSVHTRTRKEMSKVPAHFELLGEITKLRDKVAPDTLIVGNGDIESRSQGIELARKYNLDGVMIGRGVFRDPLVFAEFGNWDSFTKPERVSLYRKQIDLFAETWQEGERNIKTLNKFCKVYINGFDGAKELREELMGADSIAQLRGMLESGLI